MSNNKALLERFIWRLTAGFSIVGVAVGHVRKLHQQLRFLPFVVGEPSTERHTTPTTAKLSRGFQLFAPLVPTFP